MNKPEFMFMGKQIKDLNREQLIDCINILTKNGMDCAYFQDKELKAENERLIKENEKLWKCLQK